MRRGGVIMSRYVGRGGCNGKVSKSRYAWMSKEDREMYLRGEVMMRRNSEMSKEEWEVLSLEG